MAALEDDVRKITVNLGFNVLVLPEAQNLGDLFADDYAAETMPEEYAERLARSRVATINHVLPSLQRKVKWPEQNRTILLMGVRGEVYLHRPDNQKPILEAVPPGGVVVGYELHRSLGIEMGQTIEVMGRTFTVSRLNPERGTKDDITLWINLREAQKMLGLPGRINGILALDCTCAADRLSLIREEILKILPDTQVIEFASQAMARAEARPARLRRRKRRSRRNGRSATGCAPRRKRWPPGWCRLSARWARSGSGCWRWPTFEAAAQRSDSSERSGSASAKCWRCFSSERRSSA